MSKAISEVEGSNFKIKTKNINDCIYVNLGFWVYPKEDYDDISGYFLKRSISKSINKIFSEIKTVLSTNESIDIKNSIFIPNLPDNFFYNSKRNFINIEIYFYKKAKSQNNLSGFLNDIVESYFLSSELIQEKDKFSIFKNSK
jgi:hypothetical protein